MTVSAVAGAIRRLQDGEILTREDTTAAFRPILDRDFEGCDVSWGTMFSLLHQRGASTGEVMGLIDAILSYDPELDRQLRDKIELNPGAPVVAITGSGKESFKTFNVSTASAIVASAHPGVCVIKPAGRATSANTGASDVLAELGIQMPRSLAEIAPMARSCGLGVFDYHLTAPRYGPRYENRFHHLHPLSHVTPWLFIPVRLDGLVFGVAEPRVELAARAMAASGVHCAAVVSTGLGNAGQIDELAPFGNARLATVANGEVMLACAQNPAPGASQLDAIRQSASHQANAAAIQRVLSGQAHDAATSLVCANAGLLLHLAGAAPDRDHGGELAREIINSGLAACQLDRCRTASRH